MTYYDQNALKLCHAFWRERLRTGMTCVDATAGRGRDAEVLCRLIGEEGHLFAFDIQPEAVESTRERLTDAGLMERATLICASHSRMAEYVPAADAVVFNLGYLPHGNHAIGTTAAESIPAVEAALSILAEDGFVTICLYYGGDSGYAEHDALLAYLAGLDAKKYTVMVQQFLNRPNCPPIFIVIEKNR